jgi:hypothetical protein
VRTSAKTIKKASHEGLESALAVKAGGMMIYIYGLYDRRGRLRYIGQAKNPRERLKGHWGERDGNGQGRKVRWLRTLSKPPEMRVLAVIEDMYDEDDIANNRPTEIDVAEGAAIIAAVDRFGWDQILNELTVSKNGSIRKTLASPDYRARLSANAKALWEDPEFRAKQNNPERLALRSEYGKKQMAINWQDPAFREMRRAAIAIQWADPGFRAKQKEATQEMWRDPEMRAYLRSVKKISNKASTTALWQDPDYRAKLLAAVSQNPEWREEHSARMREMYKDPEYFERWLQGCLDSWTIERRKSESARMSARWADPGKRQDLLRNRPRVNGGTFTSDSMRARWKDPDFRAKMASRLSGPLHKPSMLDRPCKSCGAPAGIFKVGCKTCSYRKRHPFWARYFAG